MKSSILSFLLLFSVISNAQSIKSDLILGKWYNNDKTEIIQITNHNEILVGHITWMSNPKDVNGNPKLDEKNPNKALRKQKVLGSKNIFGLQYKNGKWSGSIYSYKRGGSVKFDILSVSQTELTIKISIGFFSKNLQFTRVK